MQCTWIMAMRTKTRIESSFGVSFLFSRIQESFGTDGVYVGNYRVDRGGRHQIYWQDCLERMILIKREISFAFGCNMALTNHRGLQKGRMEEYGLWNGRFSLKKVTCKSILTKVGVCRVYQIIGGSPELNIDMKKIPLFMFCFGEI